MKQCEVYRIIGKDNKYTNIKDFGMFYFFNSPLYFSDKKDKNIIKKNLKILKLSKIKSLKFFNEHTFYNVLYKTKEEMYFVIENFMLSDNADIDYMIKNGDFDYFLKKLLKLKIKKIKIKNNGFSIRVETVYYFSISFKNKKGKKFRKIYENFLKSLFNCNSFDLFHDELTNKHVSKRLFKYLLNPTLRKRIIPSSVIISHSYKDNFIISNTFYEINFKYSLDRKKYRFYIYEKKNIDYLLNSNYNIMAFNKTFYLFENTKRSTKSIISFKNFLSNSKKLLTETVIKEDFEKFFNVKVDYMSLYRTFPAIFKQYRWHKKSYKNKKIWKKIVQTKIPADVLYEFYKRIDIDTFQKLLNNCIDSDDCILRRLSLTNFNLKEIVRYIDFVNFVFKNNYTYWLKIDKYISDLRNDNTRKEYFSFIFDTILSLKTNNFNRRITFIHKKYWKNAINIYNMNYNRKDNVIKKLHDIAFIVNNINNYVSPVKFQYINDFLKFEKKFENYEFILPKDNIELKKWGHILNICVGSYDTIISDNLVVFGILNKNKQIVACIELQKEKNSNIVINNSKYDFSVYQVRSYNNKIPNENILSVFLKWCDINDIFIKDGKILEYIQKNKRKVA